MWYEICDCPWVVLVTIVLSIAESAEDVENPVAC